MQDNNSNNGRRNNGGLVIGLVIAAIFLLTFAPSLVPLLIVGGIIFTVVRNARNAQNGTTGNNTPYNPNGAPYPGTGAGAPPTTTYTYTGSYQPQQGQQPNGMPPPAIQAAPQPIVVTHTAAAPVSLVSPHGAPPPGPACCHTGSAATHCGALDARYACGPGYAPCARHAQRPDGGSACDNDANHTAPRNGGAGRAPSPREGLGGLAAQCTPRCKPAKAANNGCCAGGRKGNPACNIAG